MNIRRGDGTLMATGSSRRACPIKQDGANYMATIADLQAGQAWTVRECCHLEPSGEPGTRLFAIDFATPAKTSYYAESLAAARTLLVASARSSPGRSSRWWRRRK